VTRSGGNWILLHPKLENHQPQNSTVYSNRASASGRTLLQSLAGATCCRSDSPSDAGWLCDAAREFVEYAEASGTIEQLETSPGSKPCSRAERGPT
jgi:hypothetical protein